MDLWGIRELSMNDLIAVTRNVGLRDVSEVMLARIGTGLVEHQRQTRIFGRDDSQTTRKLCTLPMFATTGYRLLRQCVCQIQSRELAIKDNLIRLKRSRLEALQARQEAECLTGYQRELRLLDAEEKEQGIESSRTYIEGALKDLACLIDARDQIRKSHNIPENWDEADFEAAEIEGHVKAVFRLAYHDMLHHGHISTACAEYAESFGIHPAVVREKTAHYHNHTQNQLVEGNLKVTDLFDWLQHCYEAHKNDVQLSLDHLGVTDLVTKWSLYVEPE